MGMKILKIVLKVLLYIAIVLLAAYLIFTFKQVF